MTLLSACALSIAMLILAITPGPGVMVTVSKSLKSGALKSVPAILGIVSGDLFFVSLVLLGLTSVAGNLEWMYGVLTWIGVVYLVDSE